MTSKAMPDVYKTQQVMTASPEQLTLMLYNGALRFSSEAVIAITNKNIAQANEAGKRAQDIICEFRSTLNMDYSIAKDMDKLYEYIEHLLLQGNIKKEVSYYEDAKDLIKEMRDTWFEAMKKAKHDRPIAGGNGEAYKIGG